MKKIILFTAVLFFSCSSILVGQQNVLMDFGDTGNPTSGNWNNVTGYTDANQTLIDDQGTATGYTLLVTDAFHFGSNATGTTAPAGTAAIFPSSATRDSFFGHTGVFNSFPSNPVGIFTLSGLDPAKNYSFVIFASRTGVTDNREALYTITGLTGNKTATLNSSNNTSLVATISDAQPTSAGVLTFRAEAGPNNSNTANKFFYLGAVKMTRSDITTSIDTPAKSKTFNAYYQNGNLIVGDFTGNIKVLSLTGKTISEGNAILGYYTVGLKKGMYIVSTSQGNAKLTIR
jgi:hypothetical protein